MKRESRLNFKIENKKKYKVWPKTVIAHGVLRSAHSQAEINQLSFVVTHVGTNMADKRKRSYEEFKNEMKKLRTANHKGKKKNEKVNILGPVPQKSD